MISGPRGPVRTAPEEARCLAQSDGIEDGLEGGQVRQQEELAEQLSRPSPSKRKWVSTQKTGHLEDQESEPGRIGHLI